MSTENEMSFLDHLEELRWHLIRSSLAIIIVATLAFIAKDFIFDTLIFGPKKADFWTYELFCNISKMMGQGTSFCIQELPFRIQSRAVSGKSKISGASGSALKSPQTRVRSSEARPDQPAVNAAAPFLDHSPTCDQWPLRTRTVF